MTKRKTLHIITQAHLDPAWLWVWRDGCSEALNTMQSALDRLRENPDLRFTRSSAATYRWAQEMDPRLWTKIRERVREGRWEIVNGWIEQADCNIPSTESLIRQALYGKAYFEREFGLDVDVGYNVDSFGHSGGIPQILSKSGFRYYVFMRPQPHEMDLPILFWWESPDGSRVLCWRIPRAYCQASDASVVEEQVRAAAVEDFPPGFDDAAFFLGLGNHGGGPTKVQIAKIKDLREDDSLPELRFGTLGEFFAAIEQSSALGDIPVVRSELQHHAPGCYAAMGEIKHSNRRAERGLTQAEALSVMAGLDAEYDYRAAELHEAWWKLLFNQFHDILGGSSLPQCYVEARDSLGAACDAALARTVRAAHALARRVDTSGAPGAVLFLVNTLPWERVALVQIDTQRTPNAGDPITHLETPDGDRQPLQWCRGDSACGGHLAKLTATVRLPPCGYRALRLASGEPPEAPHTEPAFVRVREDGIGLESMRADDGTELLADPIGLVVISDTSDTWGHGKREFRDEIGRPKLVSTEIVEEGPILRTVRQRGGWQSSEIVLDITTYAEIDAVELSFRVNWQRKHEILKLEVPTALRGVRTFAKTAGGVTERVPTGEEEPAQDWVALQGKIGRVVYSVGIINDRTYSYDCLDAQFRTVLVRSAMYAQSGEVTAEAQKSQPCLDQGWQERRFWLVRCAGDWTQLGIDRLSAELQIPPEYAVDCAHPGTESWEKSYISVSPEPVSVTAVKRSEDGEGIVVRMQEMHGSNAAARLEVPGLALDWEGAIAPWEIKTLKVTLRPEGAKVTETDLLEREREAA